MKCLIIWSPNHNNYKVDKDYCQNHVNSLKAYKIFPTDEDRAHNDDIDKIVAYIVAIVAAERCYPCMILSYIQNLIGQSGKDIQHCEKHRGQVEEEVSVMPLTIRNAGLQSDCSQAVKQAETCDHQNHPFIDESILLPELLLSKTELIKVILLILHHFAQLPALVNLHQSHNNKRKDHQQQSRLEIQYEVTIEQQPAIGNRHLISMLIILPDLIVTSNVLEVVHLTGHEQVILYV